MKRVLSWPALKKRLALHRRRGEKIVFTNGCFDLLHVGHLKVFESCKAMGDVLVVGLNADASVRRLKGPNRPVVPQADRAALIAGLKPVDYVVLFPQDTPQKLIELVRPDVLAKGGDWKASDIVGREVAGRVARIPLVKGRSTTGIVERVLARYASPKR